MLSPKKLLEYKKKSGPNVYSLGQKLSDPSNSNFDAAQLEIKLKNMEELLSMERVKMTGQLSKAVWRPDLKKAEVTEKTGSYWETFGHSVGLKKYLYPEEALYLVDIGALELKFNDLPLSLQRSYFLLLTNTSISMDQYRVFSHLSLLGYKVMRHTHKNILTKYEKDIDIHKIGIKHRDIKLEPKINHKEKVEHQITNAPFSAINYSTEDVKKTILEKLQAIGPQQDVTDDSEMEVPVDFDVFVPTSENSQFRKSTVQLPNFRIRVFTKDASVPDLRELTRQRNHFEDEIPLIYAIVNPDFINFLQIASITLPSLND